MSISSFSSVGFNLTHLWILSLCVSTYMYYCYVFQENWPFYPYEMFHFISSNLSVLTVHMVCFSILSLYICWVWTYSMSLVASTELDLNFFVLLWQCVHLLWLLSLFTFYIIIGIYLCHKFCYYINGCSYR